MDHTTSPDVARIDARVTALEHSVDGMRTDLTGFMAEMRGVINKPRDHSTTWQIVGICGMMLVAGTGALFTVVTQSDKALDRRIEKCESDLGGKASVELVAAQIRTLDRQLQREEMDEFRELVRQAFRQSASTGYSGAHP